MSRPRVDLIAPPFRGHLHPMIGLGCALAEIADVRVLTGAALVPEVSASGLAGHGLLAGAETTIAAIADPPRRVGGNPLRLAAQFRATLDLLDRMRAELRARWAEERPVLVIADSVLPVAGAVAQEFGVPWWTSTVSPCVIESRSGPPAYLGGWAPRGDAWGRTRDAAGRALVRMFKCAVWIAHRRRLRALGFDRPYRANGDEAIYSPDAILGLGMAELEFPRAWPAAFRFIGPVLHTPPSPAPPLALEPGATHLLVTFGTQLPWIKGRMAAAAAAIAHELPDAIVHFTDGRPDAGTAATEKNFRRHAYVPYDRDLARFALVVHHGGTGVMYHCIRAGVPCVVLPADYDHFDHAARIAHAGIGLRARRAAELPELVRRALADARLRENTRRLQRALAAYDPGATLRELFARRFGLAASSAP
jgi:UDP:flavonoid glycosyltransferase YjiC (YdhE family)